MQNNKILKKVHNNIQSLTPLANTFQNIQRNLSFNEFIKAMRKAFREELEFANIVSSSRNSSSKLNTQNDLENIKDCLQFITNKIGKCVTHKIQLN